MHPGEWVLVEYWWLWGIVAIVQILTMWDYLRMNTMYAYIYGYNLWTIVRTAIGISFMIACIIVALKALYHRFLL